MTPPIYLIPGLGADHRNYSGPWKELPNCTSLDWPEYHGKAAMPEVAKFMAEAWQLPPGAILIGSSFGGMLACEIAKFLPVHTVVLIASTTTRENFTTTARMKWLLRFVWLRLAQRVLHCAQPLLEKIWGRAPRPVARAVLDSIQMFTVCQPGFYRNMFHAVSTWDGWDDPAVRLLRVHGTQDELILPPAHADLFLDGGHLIGMTRARDCVNFIQSWLAHEV